MKNWTTKSLLADFDGITVRGVLTDRKLNGITADSRHVRQGYIYAAIPGQKFDGHAFIADAIRNGAEAVLCDSQADLSAYKDEKILFLLTENTRATFARLVARFYHDAPETIVAVTGTNGKTSVVHYVRAIWELLGVKGASLGTLGVVSPGRVQDGRMTTPDPVNLHAELADLAAVGVNHLAMEASSHGIVQHRLDGLNISAAAFTNISHDHLDYHTSMEEYYQAKAKLFTTLLQKGGTAVINMDEEEGVRLSEDIKALRPDVKIIEYGQYARDIHIVELKPNATGQHLVIEMAGIKQTQNIALVGAFQTYNLCAALGLVYASMPEISVEKLLNIMPKMSAPRGRLEVVSGHPKRAGVYVDYAHTPDALKHILHAMRAHTSGKLIVVFGCGGDRDKSKRPVMGRIACEYADHVIVTDDNPRSEDPEQIRREIIAACPGAEDIGNRAYAIHKAVQMADEGDIVVIAGKGHERGQMVKGNILPFDDVAITREAIDALV